MLFYSGANSNHTYMYVGVVRGARDCRVHARSGMKPHGVFIDVMPQALHSTRAFCCRDEELATLAVDYIVGWAHVAPEIIKFTDMDDETAENQHNHKPLTRFDFDRLCTLVAPSEPADPFTAASLRRALDYARRRFRPLSDSAGTTCTTLLIAAYQAALLARFSMGQVHRLQKAYQVLRASDDAQTLSADDAWRRVYGILKPARSFEPLERVFPPSLRIESITANAGSPWRDVLVEDEGLWSEIDLRPTN